MWKKLLLSALLFVLVAGCCCGCNTQYGSDMKKSMKKVGHGFSDAAEATADAVSDAFKK